MDKQKELEVERAKEIKTLPDWHKVIRGTLMKYYLTCGNKGCHCHKENGGHGPYWYISVNFGIGKQKMYLIDKKQLRETREGIKAYNQLWDKLCRISTLNIELLKLKGKKVSQK